jgi:hypothetical protein
MSLKSLGIRSNPSKLCPNLPLTAGYFVSISLAAGRFVEF